MSTTSNFPQLERTDLIVCESETISESPEISVITSDPTPQQILRIQETAPGLAFWADDAEDIYTLEDGEPV